MNKQEKIESLATTMQSSTRAGGEEFYHFTDTAPQELKDLFMESYDITDIAFETFASACEVVREVYSNMPEATENNLEEAIYESESASIYTNVRLSYINNNNEYDISDIVQEYATDSISAACAIWYDKQVQEQALIIKDWINA